MDSQRMFGLSPWVRRLLVANLVVFLCQKTVLVDPRFQSVLEFDPLSALARPWTFVTYMFLHSGLLHLAFNLLALFMFGPPVEERMGGRRFILYYFLCGLGGAALSFALMQLKPVGPIVGASAAVYGVLLAFAWYWPDQPIYVFPFPVPIRAKWLVTFAVGISFLLALLTLSDGVAYLAHLGGFAAGFLYLKASGWWLARAERQLRRTPEASVVVQSARVAGGGSGEPPKRPRPPLRDAAQAEIDRVLDKISARGIDSLTPAERRFLSEMSRKMRDRP
ncbi:MAG TPA: rhomboid family intramembrane serine protease [Gemmatimonadales bacterium]|nr:rhomboid family intramembrane serine protease [Gemmatimonadales bacterium]